MYIDNDTLKVMSIASKKISKYDLDGKFYKDEIVDQLQLQNTVLSPDGKRMATFVTEQIPKEGGNLILDFHL